MTDLFMELTDFQLIINEDDFEFLMSKIKKMIAHKYA